jgi:hypothetical protein
MHSHIPHYKKVRTAKEQHLVQALKAHMTYVAFEYYATVSHLPKPPTTRVIAGSFKPFPPCRCEHCEQAREESQC